MRPVIRALGALSAAGLLAATLTACSDSTPDPAPTAQALAAALGSGDFTAVPLAADAPQDVAAIVSAAYERMAPIPHTHAVGEVTRHDDDQSRRTASAVIHTVWDVDEGPVDLEYDTTATLVYDEQAGTWRWDVDAGVLAPGMSQGDYLEAMRTPAERGRVLGADDTALVTARPVVRVGLDKSHLDSGQWEDSARELAELVGIDPDAYAQSVAGAGAKAWVQAIVLRDDASREATDAQIRAIPGAGVQPDELPLSPTRDFARPLLGTVGPATAENIEQSDGAIRAGDEVGRSGLQATYNQLLSGTPGTTITRNSSGHEQQAELFASEPVAGGDLRLTLDEQLQRLADQLVADASSPAALVAIRPSDGAVLAAASGPSDNGYNTALLGRYAPGSVFKVVSALAMLRDGTGPQDTVTCTETTTVDGKSFKNYDGYPAAALGRIPLREALAESCNTVFVNAGAKLGAPAVADAAAALGLTAEDATRAGAFMGQVPDDSTGTELAANMIGQGVVQASTLGMATVAASVSAGHTVTPQLVLREPAADAAVSSSGTASAAPSSSATTTAPAGNLTEVEAGQLSSMMAQVVESGTLTLLKDVPGGKIIGKSGTAEYDADRNAHAWTIAAQGDLAVAAFVENGQGGAQTAGPLVRDFLTQLPR